MYKYLKMNWVRKIYIAHRKLNNMTGHGVHTRSSVNYRGNLVFRSTAMGWAYSSYEKYKRWLLNFDAECCWETSS
jgi:hypothetical protein